jgi:hypothetical protein
MEKKPIADHSFLKKDVFEIHMQYLQNSLDGIRDMSVKIVDRLEQQEKVLYRNTLTVEEHHKRSNQLEQRQDEFLLAVRGIRTDMQEVVHKITDIEGELAPMKEKAEMNAKFIDQILWIRNNRGLILKLMLMCGIVSIIMYILLKDVDAIKQLLKVVF